MAYLTSAQLKQYQTLTQNVRLAESHRATKAMADSTGVTVFLSHSHHDKDHVEAACLLLETLGATIYVDWQDGEMPAITSADTATKLKFKIRECDRLVLLASERSLTSKWVPWELGYAEGKKGIPQMAVLPFVASQTWEGSEYIGLYPTIELTANGSLAVFPAGDNKGTPLAQWLLRS